MYACYSLHILFYRVVCICMWLMNGFCVDILPQYWRGIFARIYLGFLICGKNVKTYPLVHLVCYICDRLLLYNVTQHELGGVLFYLTWHISTGPMCYLWTDIHFKVEAVPWVTRVTRPNISITDLIITLFSIKYLFDIKPLKSLQKYNGKIDAGVTF